MSVFPLLVAVAFAKAGIVEGAVLMGIFAAFVGYSLIGDAVRS